MKKENQEVYRKYVARLYKSPIHNIVVDWEYLRECTPYILNSRCWSESLDFITRPCGFVSEDERHTRRMMTALHGHDPEYKPSKRVRNLVEKIEALLI